MPLSCRTFHFYWTMTPPAIDTVILGQGLPDSADARFGLRLLQMQWSAHTRVLSGWTLAEGLALAPPQDDAWVLWVDGPWVSPDRQCLTRLHEALQRHPEKDVAWACDSTHPAPMSGAGYATMQGMARFVAEHPVQIQAVPPASAPTMGKFGLASGRGWRKLLAGQAQVMRVSGAWAHDASGYFGGDRREVLPLLPQGMTHMLDVGGGEGGFLCAAKQAHPQVQTQLVELTSVAAAKAKLKPGIHGVWVGSFFDWYPSTRYDCISFLDVLEHMVDPEQALLHAKHLLTPTGAIVMSLPNVGHWSVVADLLEGHWDWAPAGIHCYTHLRFFTRQTIEDLLARVGLVAQVWDAVRVPCPPPWATRWQTPGLQLNNDSLDVYAHLIRATPRATA
jgi:SAM-dependent methyltransferase